MAYLGSFEFRPYKEPVTNRHGDTVLGVAKFKLRTDVGDSESFKPALAVIKSIPWRLRDWSDEKTLWTIQVTVGIKALLCANFENAADLFDAAERQLSLF